MSLNIYTDEPSKTDIFEGKAHEKLALKLSEIAQSDKVSIIGLDGYLGSGKSTIIDMAMEKIESNDVHVMKFDSEIYHYGATKKALIDILYEGFKNTPGVNLEGLSKCKDYALGNIYNYKRNVNSKVSLWTLAFICTSVICMQTLRFFITDFASLFTTKHLPFSLYFKVALEFILVLSPAIVGLLFKINKEKSDDNGVIIIRKPSFGDILKRNSEDTITEKIIINKEVGTLELKAALEGFINCTPVESRLILIIDNLDRISSSKIKEIWSDIELITEVAGNRLKILIPYSGKHVAKALSEDEKEGLEFISKRIPVTFFVPPLISAGWRNGFVSFWEETFDELDKEECYEICELIERWLPENYSSVTPRFIKRIINDINVTSLTSPNFPMSRVLIAFYILMVRYSLFDFKLLISNYENNEIKEGGIIDGVRMTVSHKQFNRIFDTEDVWKKGLICIHFQTNSEFAMAELIDEPVLNSIKYRSPQEFINLSSMYGFEQAWKKSLNSTPINELVYFLDSLSSKDLKITQKILPEMLVRLNKDYPIIENYDADLTHALVKVNRKILFNPKESFISKRADYLKNKLSSPTDFIKLEREFCLNIFEETNLLLEITQECFTKDFPDVSGEIFFGFLLDWEEEYPKINISEISLDDVKITNGIVYSLDNDLEFDLFSPQIIEGMQLNSADFEKMINGEVIPRIEDIYLKLNSNNEIDSIYDLRKLSLDKRWRINNLSSYFQYQNKLLTNNPNDYYAALISHKISAGDNTSIPNLASVEITDEFIDILYNYFHFAKDLNTLVAGLSNNELKDIISPAIKKIIENKKVKRVNVSTFIRSIYNPIRELVGVSNALSFFNAWDANASTSLSDKNHETISQDFIRDLGDREDYPIFKREITQLMVKRLSSKELILSYVKQPQIIYREMINLIASNSFKINISNNTRVFSDFYIEEEIKSLTKLNYIHDIISIIDSESLEEIIKTLMDLLERKDLDPLRQVFAIRDLGYLIKYDAKAARTDNRAIAKLFSYATEYDFLAEWLDGQKYSFSKWSKDDKKTVESFVLNNITLFPRLIETQYFRNRSQSLDSETDNHNNEDSYIS